MRQGKEKVMERERERGCDATSREVNEQLTDSGRKVRERLALSPSLSPLLRILFFGESEKE